MAATRTITCPVSGGYRIVLGWGMILHAGTWHEGEINLCEHEDDQGNGAPLVVVVVENAESISTRDLTDVYLTPWPLSAGPNLTTYRFSIAEEHPR